jgi:LL-diaminopimelate aminotransferase
MAYINENYLKLRGAYLFPEINRRVGAFLEHQPDAADRIINCGIGDVTEPLPVAARDAMHAAVDEMGCRETFHGYGPPTGYDWLRQAIARGDFGQRGLTVDPDEIFVSDGSKVDCGAILDVLATGKRNVIGIVDPVYPAYVDTNVMAGNTGDGGEAGEDTGLVHLPCTVENGFVPEPPDISLDLVYLCYPNNPTGGMIDRARLQSWVEYANENDTLILYDVAYEAFVRQPELPRSIYEIEGARQCAMEFHSFSKNGGFTGVRCGYTVCPRELTGRTEDGQRIALHGLWTRRWSTKSNGVSYIVQRAAEALYGDEGRLQIASLIDHYLENAAILRDGCVSVGLTVYGGDNAPYVWVACPDGVTSWDMFDRLLMEANVVTTPGSGFGRCGEGYVRLSAFNTRQNVQEVVRRVNTMGVSV